MNVGPTNLRSAIHSLVVHLRSLLEVREEQALSQMVSQSWPLAEVDSAVAVLGSAVQLEPLE